MSENDTLGFGGFTPPPGPPRKTHRIRNWVVIPLASLAGLIIVIGITAGLAGSGSKAVKAPVSTPSTFAPSSAPATATDLNGVSCAAPDMTDGYCPGDLPASAPDTAQDLTGPLGTTFTVTETDTSTGVQDSYTVTAVKVLDPARGSDEFSTAEPGKRLIGVKFTITGTGGYAHDDANVTASLQGDDGQVYQPDFTSLAAGTNFNAGDFSVTNGRTQTGWVTFQVPQGVKVDSVQWQGDLFGDQQPATWQL